MIFFEANTFKKEFIRKVCEVRTEDYKRSTHDEYPIPYCITLASFACELFIKFLIGVSKIKEDNEVESIGIPKGHDLKKLHDELSVEYKKLILDKIEKKTLTRILERNANSFMESRYIYESNKNSVVFNYDDIKRLINVLYEIAYREKNSIYFDAGKATHVMLEGTDTF